MGGGVDGLCMNGFFKMVSAEPALRCCFTFYGHLKAHELMPFHWLCVCSQLLPDPKLKMRLASAEMAVRERERTLASLRATVQAAPAALACVTGRLQAVQGDMGVLISSMQVGGWAAWQLDEMLLCTAPSTAPCMCNGAMT